jgi:hypothetical protein
LPYYLSAPLPPPKFYKEAYKGAMLSLYYSLYRFLWSPFRIREAYEILLSVPLLNLFLFHCSLYVCIVSGRHSVCPHPTIFFSFVLNAVLDVLKENRLLILPRTCCLFVILLESKAELAVKCVDHELPLAKQKNGKPFRRYRFT